MSEVSLLPDTEGCQAPGEGTTDFLLFTDLRTCYLHNPVHSQDQRKVMSGQADGLQDNGDGEDPSSWYACCPDTGCCGCHSRGWHRRLAINTEHGVGTEKCKIWRLWLRNQKPHNPRCCQLSPSEMIHSLQVMNSCCHFPNGTSPSHGEIGIHDVFQRKSHTQ